MPIIFLILSTAAVSTLLGHSHQLAGRDFFWPITAGGMGGGGIWLLWVVISKNISSMRKLTLVIIGFLVSAGQRMFCFVKEHPKRNKKYLWINTHMWQWSYLLGTSSLQILMLFTILSSPQGVTGDLSHQVQGEPCHTELEVNPSICLFILGSRAHSFSPSA